MNDRQWETLVGVIRGDELSAPPTGFIIDSRSCRGGIRAPFTYRMTATSFSYPGEPL